MSEEPDDGREREPSDSSASGSDEREPADEEAKPDCSDAGESTPTDGADDATDAEDADDEETDADQGSPDFTDVAGLGPDHDPEDEPSDDADDEDDPDDPDGDDSDGHQGYDFEEYDPYGVPDEDEDDDDDEESAINASSAMSNAAARHGVDAADDDTTDDATGDADATAEEGLLGGAPEEDEEMPLAAHIEEMMRRLSVVFLVGGAVALTLLGLGQLSDQVPTAVDLIDILWNNAIPGAPEIEGRRPRVYSPLELILTELKVTALAGLLVALPVFVYESYLFMRPGLYPRERRYYLSAIPTSLILGTVGMAFSHYIIIPAIMRYFTLYTDENVATVAYGLSDTFSLILVLMGYMAVIFQIPLFIMLAIMMGLVTRVWLEDKRLLFWGGFLTIAFLVNPDPTGMTPFIIAATMIVLYEGTLALLRWTGN